MAAMAAMTSRECSAIEYDSECCNNSWEARVKMLSASKWAISNSRPYHYDNVKGI